MGFTTRRKEHMNYHKRISNMCFDFKIELKNVKKPSTMNYGSIYYAG